MGTTVLQPQCMVLCYYAPAVSGSYCGIRIRILFKNPHSKTKQNKKKKIQKYPNVPSDHSVATPVYGSMLLHARCVWFLLRNSYTDSVLRIHTAKQNKTKKRKSKNIRMYPVTTVLQPQCMVLRYYTPAVSGSYCGIRIRILF